MCTNRDLFRQMVLFQGPIYTLVNMLEKLTRRFFVSNIQTLTPQAKKYARSNAKHLFSVLFTHMKGVQIL